MRSREREDGRRGRGGMEKEKKEGEKIGRTIGHRRWEGRGRRRGIEGERWGKR